MRVTEIAQAAVQGSRADMQDVVLCVEQPSDPEVTIIGVFDGHGERGNELAEIAAGTLGKCSQEMTFQGAQEYAWFFRSVLRSLNRHLIKTHVDMVTLSGTTATMAAIKSNVAAITWLGDSEARYYTDDGQEIPLTNPHTAENAQEASRVKALGYKITDGGYFGNALQISRAVGDYRDKFVIDEAETESLSIDQPGILVVASDGVWRGSRNGNVQTALSLWQQEGLQAAVHNLVSVFAQYSVDNASAVAVRVE